MKHLHLPNSIKMLLAALALVFLWANAAFASNGLEVHFLDVGQGDAAFITCDGHAMLIDGGYSDCSQFIYAYLKEQGVTYLDYIVATHADADHVGGLSAAVAYARNRIGLALAPYADSEKERFQTFKRKLEENGIKLTVPEIGSEYQLGGASFRILSGPGLASDSNVSLVLRLTYGNHSFLFTGDAEYEQETEIVNSVFETKSTVLKVGHHGSDTSSSYRFLRDVMPKYAVISVGKDNSYGHPTDNVLSRLRDAEVTVLRTDNNGTIIFRSDGKKLTYTTEKPVDYAANLLAPGMITTWKEKLREYFSGLLKNNKKVLPEEMPEVTSKF